MRIGAHVSTRGGLLTAIEAAKGCGAEAAQIFISNPRGWASPRITHEEADVFREAWRDSGLGPLFVHAPYLVNIASPNPQFLTRSIELARVSVATCSAIGADGFVVHAGSGGPGEPREAFERAVMSLQTAAGEGDARVLVELTAGTQGSVAATFPEAAALFEAVGDPRLALCADTCHLFAAGYALDEDDGVAACFDELRATGITDRLMLVHANDAKFERGSHRDRHEDVGEGNIGIGGFTAILHRPEVGNVPFVLETPGGLESYAAQIMVLRRLAD